jgi:hypothetical protein
MTAENARAPRALDPSREKQTVDFLGEKAARERFSIKPNSSKERHDLMKRI